MDDYDVFDSTDGLGKLYLSNHRSASYTYAPGNTAIHLEDRTNVYDGNCNQVDKAEGICLAWIKEGRISPSFYPKRD